MGATTGPITVTTPDGTATSAVSFFVGQTPEVLSATPMQSKIGGTVVIQGHHFNGATRVAFGPSSNASFTVDSDDQITAVVDRNAVTGKITVVTPAAAGTSAFDFTVLPFDNFARIASILDVPHDQGGQVTLRWLRSDFDDPTDHLISGYRVWRRAPLEGVSAAAAHPTWRHEVTASGEIVYWEPMTLVPAAFLDGYAYVSPTTQDSTEDGNPFTAFSIQTLTSDPTVFYNSPVDSGYSVDNEPPHKPPKSIKSSALKAA